MLRLVLIIPALLSTLIVLVPLQLLALALNLTAQRHITRLFHIIVCRLLGVRIHQVGARETGRPVLVLANHVSWLDISVIGACTPVVFVAKAEVSRWPAIGRLAKLQHTIFIDRDKRRKTDEATRDIAQRLSEGNAVVLFAEGTSSNSTRVLPFRSALIGAAHQALQVGGARDAIAIQPLSLAYVGFSGVPVGRTLRDHVAWYGDADLLPHLINIIKAGAIDVVVSWGEPSACDLQANRKLIARDAEAAVRRMTRAAATRDISHTPEPLREAA